MRQLQQLLLSRLLTVIPHPPSSLLSRVLCTNVLPVGIELLNEPATIYQLGPISVDLLLTYYKQVSVCCACSGGTLPWGGPLTRYVAVPPAGLVWVCARAT